MEIRTKFDEGDTVVAIIDDDFVTIGVISDIRMDKGGIRYTSESWATWIKEEFLFAGEEAKEKLLEKKSAEIKELNCRYDKMIGLLDMGFKPDTY